MTREEVRIGNIVRGSIYYDTEDAKLDLGESYSKNEEWIQTTIKAILPELDDIDFYLECDSECKRVEGVPITNELLNALGFYHYIDSNFEIWTISVGDFTYNFEFTIMRDILKDNFYFKHALLEIEMTYIHQIQNLYFAMVGKELKIQIC